MRHVPLRFAFGLSLLGLAGGAAAVACSSSTPADTDDGCTILAACCPTLPSTEGSECSEVASLAVAASCSEELLTVMTAGYCKPGGSGTSSTAGASSQSECAALTACCAHLSGTAESDCEALAMVGTPSSCAMNLALFTTTGACGGASAGSSSIATGTGVSTTGGSVSSAGTGSVTGFSTVTGGTGTGSFTGSTGPSSFSSTGSTGFSSGGSGDAGMTPECAVPATPPSGGTCVTVVPNDAGTGISCNPVTNGDCATMGAGYACDVVASDTGTGAAGFMCYPPGTSPDVNTQAVCATCNGAVGPYCVGTATCVGTTTMVCARYCCTDGDCGNGRCVTGAFAPAAPSLGTCME